MGAKRPTSEYKNKTNVNPVNNRSQEATAEDYFESAEVMENHADLLDALTGSASPNPNYGVYSSLSFLQAAHPTGEAGAYAIIDAGFGDTPQLAIWDVNDLQWSLTAEAESIVYVINYAALPTPGIENKIYITTFDYKIFVWKNNQYNELSKSTGTGSGTTEPPVAQTYQEVFNLLGEQNNQTADYLYKVINAADDPAVLTGEGSAIYLYLGTTNGDLTDYNLIWKSENSIQAENVYAKTNAFSGNLSSDDDTVQKIAKKVDELPLGEDYEFTLISENEYGEHPSFSDQHSFNVWVLSNMRPQLETTLKIDNITNKGFDYLIEE